MKTYVCVCVCVCVCVHVSDRETFRGQNRILPKIKRLRQQLSKNT